MNICYLSKTFGIANGGIESYTLSMAQALAGRGHSVHIVARGKADGTQVLEHGILLHTIRHRDSLFKGAWHIERHFPLSWVVYSRKVSHMMHRIVERYSIEVIESPNWCLEGMWYSFKKTIPLVVRMHVCTPEYARLGIIKSHIRAKTVMRIERYLLRNADAVTSPSLFVARETCKAYPRAGQITVIPNSVDDGLIGLTKEQESERPLVLFVGRLEKNKGIEVMEKIIEKVLSVRTDTLFLFVGMDTRIPGTRKLWGARLMEKYPGNVESCGQLPSNEVIAAYQRAWCCLVPSLSEAFGMSAVEATACGTPVIASATGGLKEIIQEGVNGLLVEPGDHEGFSDAVVRLISEHGYRRELSAKAAKLSLQRYAKEIITEKAVRLYEKTIRGYAKG